jgi:fido (protein-threonine AMPylation protein)
MASIQDGPQVKNPALQTVKYFWLFKDVLKVDPEKLWVYCSQLQKEWDNEFSKDATLVERMARFKKDSALTFVWVADKLAGNPPGDVGQKETYRLLSELYDLKDDDDVISTTVPDQTETNAETDRRTQFQLKQHFVALKRIIKAADQKQDLSEQLIRSVHRDLMKGLKTEKGEEIRAGEYRQGPVSAGNFSFPDYKEIPKSMKSHVDSYNKKLKANHDMFELASWLLYWVVSLHPFEDGNGRLCRLLWCFSLLHDGLPFPLTLSDGHYKAHDHYVECIIKDRRVHRSPCCPALTTLTVVSIKEKWENFISNISFEYREGYEKITEWLEKNDLIDI